MLLKRSIASLLVAVALLTGLAACGDDTESTRPASAESSAGGPSRIVSLSPTATEMLFAIGAGDQVIAVDDQSNYPADAPKTELSGFEPNLEAIIKYEPDLVVASDLPDDVVQGLESVHATVIEEPAATKLDDTYDEITKLGDATGHRSEAATLVSKMRDEIDSLTAKVPHRTAQPTYYYELDNTLYTVTSQTFIGQLFTLAGLTNVADPADASGQFGGYPQLSSEFLVNANPTVIFLADTKCCGQNEQTVAARPGFAGLAAVTNHHVVELDDDIASRWGPRVVDLLRTIVEATTKLGVRRRAPPLRSLRS